MKLKLLSSTEYYKLQELRVRDEHRDATANEFRRTIKELEVKLEDQADKHKAEVRRLKREHVLETEELAVLKKLKLNSQSVVEREISLTAQESLLKAKNAEFDSLAKELAKATEKAEKARAEGVKEGYADGVADGLRKAVEITAEDRKMMGQIAALAASSHQSDASKSIAEAIAKDIHHALPATTKQS